MLASMLMVKSSPVGDHACFEPIPSSPFVIALFGVLAFDRALSSSSDKCQPDQQSCRYLLSVDRKPLSGLAAVA